MSEYGSNKSFVLRGVEDTIYEERPVPEREFQSQFNESVLYLNSDLITSIAFLLQPVGPHDVLVEVKKTGQWLLSSFVSIWQLI